MSSDSILKTETIQMMAGAALLSAFTYVPILAERYFGADHLYISLIVGSYAMASFIASYIFGRAGDIYGRRLVIRIGLLASALSFSLLVFVNGLEVLYIARVLGGFCVGIYPGALAAFAYETDMKMGKFASFGAAGWGAGTLIAGFAAAFNIYYAFVVSSLFLTIGFATALTLPKLERKPIKVPLFPVDTFKQNWPVYLAVLIRHSSASAVWTLWPNFLDTIIGDLFLISVVQATNSVSQVIFMVAITDRIECRKLIAAGLISSAVTFLWFTVVTKFIEMIPAQLLLGFSWACLYVGALKYVTEKNEERSTAAGLLQSILAISMVIGPIMAAVLYTLWPGYTSAMLFATVMALIALVIYWFSSNGESQENEVTTPEIL
ncbi:MAG: MFS transporter [Candidatus Hodarchaeota archaeon]